MAGRATSISSTRRAGLHDLLATPRALSPRSFRQISPLPGVAYSSPAASPRYLGAARQLGDGTFLSDAVTIVPSAAKSTSTSWRSTTTSLPHQPLMKEPPSPRALIRGREVALEMTAANRINARQYAKTARQYAERGVNYSASPRATPARAPLHQGAYPRTLGDSKEWPPRLPPAPQTAVRPWSASAPRSSPASSVPALLASLPETDSLA